MAPGAGPDAGALHPASATSAIPAAHDTDPPRTSPSLARLAASLRLPLRQRRPAPGRDRRPFLAASRPARPPGLGPPPARRARAPPARADRWPTRSCRRNGARRSSGVPPSRSTCALGAEHVAPGRRRPAAAARSTWLRLPTLLISSRSGPAAVAHQHVHVAVVVDVAERGAAADVRAA